MLTKAQKFKSDFTFTIKQLKQMCLKRNYDAAIIKCNLLLAAIENPDLEMDQNEFELMKNNIITLIDELRFVINTEIRFILFPLPDIKKEAYEIGKKYMPNFFDWVKSDEELTPEKLIGILDEEIFRLDEAKQNISRMDF